MPRPARKSKLVGEASRLFAQKGYRDTSLREVAKNAGMLAGSVYSHFDSKEHLLFTVVQEAMGAVIDGLRPIVESDRPTTEKLHLAMANHLRVSTAHGGPVVDQWRVLQSPLRGEILKLREEYGEL